MTWKNISLSDVVKSMNDCDSVGLTTFRKKYGNFHAASDLHMYYQGRGPYEARPLIAGAYYHSGLGLSLTSNDFKNNDGHDFLENLGFIRASI
ncbi:hypothetical protein R7F06_18055 [Vibrio sp. Vb2656]|uniref:hypothetical protein n=1 Tax=unclassified Vibrio TaxID=2614977 RepID=UPI0021CE3F9D|nr:MULTISPECIES: hypothetical protein [unclassified Vibrio]MDW1664902.1 hypothetical protein [Vibrio sp. Vb2656]MDW1702270.1 hypothetical protein [Vibrio sp. Vb2657]